jgi:AbrB family looped-hinge helix DNA binding protein
MLATGPTNLRSMPLLTYQLAIDTIIGGSQNMEKVRVKVSPKFQVVIPKTIREELRIEPGQELLMYSLDGSLHLVPHRSIKELKGIAKGMRWKDEYRDNTERF